MTSNGPVTLMQEHICYGHCRGCESQASYNSGYTWNEASYRGWDAKHGWDLMHVHPRLGFINNAADGWPMDFFSALTTSRVSFAAYSASEKFGDVSREITSNERTPDF